MEPHLFTQRPTLGLIVLSVLCILFTWRAAQALRILASPPEREEPLPAQPDFQPPQPRRNRLWDLTLCVLTALALLAVMGLVMFLTQDFWGLFSTHRFYIGDLLLLSLALFLPFSTRASWYADSARRREGVLAPLYQISYWMGLWLLPAESSGLIGSWPAVIALLIFFPLAYFVKFPVLRVHGLQATSERWWFLFLLLLHAFCLDFILGNVVEVSSSLSSQAYLHDALGLTAMIVFAWIQRRTIVRAMRRDGDAPPERRVSLTGF